MLLLPRGLSKELSAIYSSLHYIAGEKAIFTTVFLTFFKPFTIRRKNRVLWGRFLKGLCTFTSLLLLCTKHTSSFCARILLPSHYYIPHFFGKIQLLFSKKFSVRVKLSIIPLLYGHGRPRNATLSENNPLHMFPHFKPKYGPLIFKVIIFLYTCTNQGDRFCTV